MSLNEQEKKRALQAVIDSGPFPGFEIVGGQLVGQPVDAHKPRAGEIKVLAKCDRPRCGGTLADLLGSEDGIRYIAGSGDGFHRSQATFDATAGQGDLSSPYVADWKLSGDRGRFRCRCGADIQFRMEKLEAAFQVARLSGQRKVFLPTDL